jgi:hypothetical protein
MLRVNVSTANGLSDPVVHILRLGAANSLVDVHRSDRSAWSKTINMDGLSKVVVIVGSREHGGDFTVTFDELASATDVMITRWNTAVGTEYEVNPRGWSWTWISPDIMVDTNGDLLDDVNVFFGQDNKLKVRLRNRGKAPASNIRVDFWYQKATPFLTTAGWIPVQNAAGATQVLTGLGLAAGAEAWFTVDWAPVDDGTHHPHWCVKAAVTVAGDPNNDNKMAFRNFSSVVVGSPDARFDTLFRFHEWVDGDRVRIVPRGPRTTLEIADREALPTPMPRGCDSRGWQPRVIDGIPLDMTFASLRVVDSELAEWDGVSTAEPDESRSYYPVDERTLPPGVRSSDIVTVAHVRDSRPFGGVSYRVAGDQPR